MDTMRAAVDEAENFGEVWKQVPSVEEINDTIEAMRRLEDEK